MRWLVGLDLRPRSDGALRFAVWLARSAPGAESFVAVHVLEEEHLRAALKVHHLDEVTAAARAGAASALAGAGVPEATVEVVQALTAEEGLTAALARHGAGALVVGRIARRDEARLVRLGRVARRLLRALPAPVLVVPPDFTPAEAEGPVVALTSLSEDSAEACHFAAALAGRLGRPLVVTHVVPFVELPFLAGGPLEEIAREQVVAGEGALAAWLEAHALRGVDAVVLQGEIVDRVDALVRERGAALVVVGATRRSGLDQLAFPSIGRELAATAAAPVAVVPPRR
jgi:nucleotide-binding universal stress UspA family protein